jgi:hypothetical protein
MRQLLTMSLPDVADVMFTETISVHSLRTVSAFSGCQAIADSRPASISVTPWFGLRQKKRLPFCR